jgi:hypothetical protein
MPGMGSDQEFAEAIVISDKEFAEAIVISDKEFAEYDSGTTGGATCK